MRKNLIVKFPFLAAALALVFTACTPIEGSIDDLRKLAGDGAGTKTYTVTFDINGGEGTVPPAQTVKAGSGITLPNGNGLTKGEYTFTGWNTESGGSGEQYSADSIYTPIANVILYARWETGFYTISFDINGGVGTVPSPQIIPSGDSITLPGNAEFSLARHIFTGWATQSDGTGTTYQAGDTFTPTYSVIFYAQWQALPENMHAVKYIANYAREVPPDEGVAEGSAINRPDNPVRDGYVFAGWYKDPGLGNLWNFYTDVVTEETVLYARWNGPLSGQYTVRFIRNGGDPFPEDMAVNSGEKLIEAGLPSIGRPDMSFGGWFKDAVCTGEPWLFDYDTVITDATLYAKWNQFNHFTVNFIPNGGTPAPQQKILAAANSIASPDVMEKDGFVFNGWYVDSGLSTEWKFSEYKVDGNINLYARWISVPDWCAAQLSALAGGDDTANPAEWVLPAELKFNYDNWMAILTALDTEGKYVELDMSACPMEGTEFDPVRYEDVGKGKIVSIILPDQAESIIGNGTSGSNRAAFRYFNNLSRIEGRNVTSICNYAFSICESLSSVDFSKVENIGYCAFAGCENLVSVNFQKVITIGYEAFSDCTGLSSVNIPLVDTIGDAAFDGCTSITGINFPATANIISNPFGSCTSLVFNLIGTGPLSTLEDGKALVRNNVELVSYPSASGNVSLETITSINAAAFFGCTYLISVSFPLLETIDISAFNGCTSLISVDLPLVETIHWYAFYGCISLTNVDFPLVKIISDNTFSGCTSLTSMDFSAATRIERWAFQDCTSLSSVYFPLVEYIDEGAFVNCAALSSVDFPLLEALTGTVFQSCTSLINVVFPKVKSIGGTTFNGCTSLSSVDFPQAVTIGNNAFSNLTNLSTAVFPLVKIIGSNAFANCTSLSSVDFPFVETIYSYAFPNCTSLSSLNIPSVTNIGNYAFRNTGTNPFTITMSLTTPALGTDIFSDVNSTKTVTVKVPTGATGYGESPTNITDDNWGNAFRGKGWNGVNYLNGTVNENIQLSIVYE